MAMTDLAMLALSLVAVVGLFFALRSDDEEDGAPSEGEGENARGWVRVEADDRE